MVRVGECSVYLDVLVRSVNYICVLSVYDVSLQRVKSFCARLNLKGHLLIEGESIESTGQYSVYISPVSRGKEKFYHAVLVNKSVGKQIIVTSKERAGEDFYHYLMREYDLPLLNWWGTELLGRAVSKGYLTGAAAKVTCGACSFVNTGGLAEIRSFEDLLIFEIDLYNAKSLEEGIRDLFEERRIWISQQPQNRLEVGSMDEYFQKYGHSLVTALEKQIQPLMELDGNCTSLALMTKRLYPQQAAMVNGVLKLLETSTYAILNEGMGVGKTLQAASICEGYHVEKYRKSHKEATLRDIYSERDIIRYRNIVMAPGHMVEKWAHEISSEIPYAKACVLNDFDQLLQIWEKGPERSHREYWVVSKDFAKLSYMSRPTPTKMRKKRAIRLKQCLTCGETFTTPDRFCPHCGNDGYKFAATIGEGSGLICPECGEPLLEYRDLSGMETIKVLQPSDFANPTNSNSKCYYCGAINWQPHVNNIDMINLRPEVKHTPWYRVTHFANKAHEAVKSVWVHKKYAAEYFQEIGEEPLNERPDTFGVRKYSPAAFIKRYMKGYWDFAVFDEAHLYKGGGTGQGNAMEALIKSSKKQLALTGTIAGGMAQHLFYLIFRLDPRRMIEKGYQWGDVMKFNRKYGTIKTEFLVDTEYGDDGISFKQMTRGKMLKEPKVEPGISPLIFTEFLLDRAVFLDLSDMSKYLPPLKEYVIPVSLGEEEAKMKRGYDRVINSIKTLLKEKGGRKLLGKLLQFSLSFLDKPYGPRVIKHPLDGSLVCKIDQFPELCSDGGMLSKEKKLVELVEKELSEGRKCFVYAEYTGSADTCVSYRIKELLEEKLGIQVAVLESMSPEPIKREAWIHEQVERNKVDVIISNPRCVETGLDFCWETGGVYFTIPTIIFYQMGYSLYTVWQASRRHFRLNQKMECRTYYLGVENSLQMMAIRIIAEKQVATSAIQGKFSSEGLSAMAAGVDMKVRLAQALAEEDYEAGSDLQGMFDILAQEGSDDTAYDGYEPMKLLREIIGETLAKELCKTVETQIDVDSLLDEIMGGREEELFSSRPAVTVKAKDVTVKSLDSLFDLFD